MSLARFASALAFLCCLPAALAQTPTAVSLALTAGGLPATTVAQGTVVRLTATVTLTGGGSARPPGQVEFCEVQAAPLRCTDIRLLGTAALTSGGTAIFKFLPGPGTHNYQAQLLGTHLQASSSSGNVGLTVTPSISPTTTTISASGTPGVYQLTATVTNTHPTPITGVVSFHDLGDSNYTVATAPLVTVSGPAYSLASGPVISTGPTYSAGIAVADFNNDGKPDIVGLSTPVNSGVQTWLTLSVMLGNGDATFAAKPPATLPNVTTAVTAADFNGDGNQDVATTMLMSNSVLIMLGNGDGTFTSKQVLSIPSPDAIVSADFNGDGIPDLAVTNASSDGTINTVTILLGNGDGTFTINSTIPTGVNPSSIVAGDFNGDGKTDLATTNSVDDTVTVLLGNGDGTFTPAPSPLTGSRPCSLTAADINGDGILDLAVLNEENLVGLAAPGSITVLLGKGDGTFTDVGATPATGLVPISIAAGDFNGDGKVDLTTANSATPFPPAQPSISVLLGNGDGTFASATNISPLIMGANPSAVAVGDFDGSGVSEIAVGALNGFIATVLPQFGSVAQAVYDPVYLVGSGGRAVDAVYPGDSNNLPSKSPNLELVAAPIATTLTIATSPASLTYGQPVLVTVTLSPDPAEEYIQATGSMTISYQGLGSSVLVSGPTTTFNVIPPAVGTYAFTVTYTGDSNFLPSKATYTITVNPALSAATLVSSLNPAYVGQTVKFTANITGTLTSALPPTGSVSFSDGSTVLGTAPLSSSGSVSTAAFSTNGLALGTHTITATYVPAGGGYQASTATLTQTINVVPQDYTITVANPSQVLAAGQTSTTTITLASIDGFVDTLSLTCPSPPTDMTCTIKPNSVKLAANGTATATLTLATYVIPAGMGRNRPPPAPYNPPLTPLTYAALLSPASLFAAIAARRRRRISVFNLVLIAAFFLATFALSGCGSVIYELPTAGPGTYTIPVTATGTSTGLTHTAVLTLNISS